MNRYNLMLIILILAVVPAVAHDCHGYSDGHHCCVGHNCSGCGPIRQQASRSPATIENLNGTISEINRAPSAAGIVEAWLKTAGSTVLVRLAPAGFLMQKGLSLNEGASIAVKAFRATSSDEDLLIATEVEIGGKRLALRNEWGETAMVSI